ncbi:amidohydrolase [Aliikangiella coralliicola]|uniref:Amidohydrolase n=1 Tax=Aliikangiella coralliicola TaxID=2592383 RepID=A0A545UIH6_9GAMM|nr:amidohydrolase [Aliikangiella coralliicola]TQV89274.1 amidohydrolase [Aliikangiella coralliicola]
MSRSQPNDKSRSFKQQLASFVSIGLLCLTGCAGGGGGTDSSTTPPPPTATNTATVYKNGNIYTVNPEQPWAEAIVIDKGKITFVGSSADAAQFEVNGAKIIDLAGKMVMPGMHDVHIHPLESGSDNSSFVLNTEENDPEKFIPAIRQASQNNPGSDWLIGYGHSVFTLLDAKRRPLEILDEAVSDRPVIIMEQTSHSMWVNSKALELAGINKDSADPVGGVIMKDKTTGEPNGILIDNAGNIVMDIAMAPTESSLKNDYDGLVNFTLPELAKVGLTSIADARAYWKRDHHKTWRKVEQEKKLTARVVLGLWAYPMEEDTSQIEMLKSLYSNDENSLLRINQIKFYSDGIPSNTTAAMHTPYQFDLLGLPGNRGLNYFTEQRLADYLKQLEPTGFDFHIHAIGERGIFEALNAIEKSGTANGRHRLTHLEIVDPNDYARFAALNVTADCQVAGEFTNPEHWGELAEFIGSDKANNLVPLRGLKDAGARVTLSSDWSVSAFNPFIGLQHAITRTPQNLSLEEAIRAYTIDSAYVMRQENKVGTIEVGKEADIIVINQNLFQIEPNKVNQTKVLQTLLAGKEVYRDASF